MVHKQDQQANIRRENMRGLPQQDQIAQAMITPLKVTVMTVIGSYVHPR